MLELSKILHLCSERGMSGNSYILELPSSSVVIDPSQELFTHFAIKDAAAIRLFATHGHFDHVYAVDKWRDRFPCKLSIHEAEQKLLTDKNINASFMTPFPNDYRPAELTFQDGDVLELGDGFYFKVIHTPGHTRGSSCFLLGQVDLAEPMCLFSGDTLFRGSVGRSDLPTGDPNVLAKSLEKLLQAAETWPEKMPVYPGHGPVTDFVWEKNHNPWL